MTVAGTRAVVTGAGNGIGRALATRLAADGATVVVNDLDGGAAEQVASAIGGIPLPGDAASEGGLATLVDQAHDRLGGIDSWFANAGIDVGRGLEASESDWALAHEINVMAHVRAARLLLPEWLERGRGRFVVTASAAGVLTMLGSPVYSVTKHGAVAFAEWLSATYRHRGIDVHAICPQGVNTRMYDNLGNLQQLVGRDTVVEPEQVADECMRSIALDRFFVLPHAEVGRYYAARAAAPDRWLRQMNKVQQQLEGRAS
ncbi:SDR family NAD(P)-dependent oxidoreductase [Nocardioides sp. CER19]|uniref:SDR family NAD(P)-dependent oxidoreductase n=1 Tax=Nocardioides sp. CER19 TaxID=3038538 RepID=UPI00244A89DA|nr:SDR family NAD(P)-dependent oxidoreductase [Nocardioides sp. CER19]MDH2416128.1 SDR family NAD(P)-dependent oxidoreductase [Nocardioides sp. CER19]